MDWPNSLSKATEMIGMFRCCSQSVFIFIVTAYFAGVLRADIIDFDSVIVGTQLVTLAAPYDEDGYRLDSDSLIPVNRSSAFGIFGTGHPGYTGAKSMFFNWQGPNYTLSRVDGQPFDLVSIDIWEFANQPIFLTTNRAELTFTGYRSDSSVVMRSTIANGIWGPETFTFPNFTRMIRVEWDIDNGTSAFHQFDNIVVNAVPEPATIVLGSIGLICLGVCARRRRLC